MDDETVAIVRPQGSADQILQRITEIDQRLDVLSLLIQRERDRDRRFIMSAWMSAAAVLTLLVCLWGVM